MTERGLPIVDGAPACPFVAFEDDRDERAASPDHRHRCYAEPQPAPRALAHQEAYCLSSAFPVCPTFQDWARREAARARATAAKSVEAATPEPAGPQRNPPRNWAAPPPWMSRRDRAEGAAGAEWAGEDDEVEQGRGLSGSYADRVASGPGAAEPDWPPDEDDVEPAAAGLGTTGRGPAGLGATGPADAGPGPAPRPGPIAARPEPTAPSYHAPGWDDDSADEADTLPRRLRRRERDLPAPAAGAPRGPVKPAPEWERARPLEAYPTLRSRRLSELSVPPMLVAIVAIALAAAVLFALPGLLGFGNPSAGGSPTPATPLVTPLLTPAPTPVPQATPQIYVVQSGDTLSRIAGRFGIPLADLIAANAENLPDPDKLQIGDQLIIPVPLPTDLPAASEIPGAT